LRRAKFEALSLEDVFNAFDRISLVTSLSLAGEAAELAERVGHPVYTAFTLRRPCAKARVS